ncbi:MAG: hypothetical protein ABEL76_07165, partial [Bradymonadaceae bacterium]
MSPSAKAVLSVAVLAAAGLAVACAWWGWTGHGIYHPDEIYQALEPAHELVYGYGLTSWEWRVGARNYALPGLLSAGFGLSTLLGLDRSPLHIAPVTALVSLLTGATALGIYRLSRAIGA